jgi:hypothetical protein
LVSDTVVMQRRGLSAERGHRRNPEVVATAASASSLAYESRLRRLHGEVRLDIADVVRDEPIILRKKIEDLHEAGAT